MKWRLLGGILLSLLGAFVIVLILTPAPKVAAVHAFDCTPYYESLDGRCMFQPYFSGLEVFVGGAPASTGIWQDTPGWTYVDSLGSYLTNYYDIPSNVDNPRFLRLTNAQVTTNFINFMNSMLNPPNPLNCGFPTPSLSYTSLDSCTDYRQYVMGAAFIILTMIGGQYTTYDVGTVFGNSITTGIADAEAEFPTWSAEVQQASAAGQIDWNEMVTTPANHPNSTSFNYAHDVGNFLQLSESRHEIVFNDPGGTYEINRRCGNTEGNFAPLAPLLTLTCGNASLSTGLVQPGGQFATTVNETYTGSIPSGSVYHVTIAGVPYTNNNAPITTAGGVVSYTTPILRAPPGAGAYPIAWQLFNGTTSMGSPCSGQLTVNDLPYFSAYGADVRAGGDFTPGCQTGSGTTGGTLGGWYDNQTAVAGAHALFGAIAIGQITGFGSAQGITAGPNTQPMGLTYANAGPGAGGSTSSATLPQMGGDYGAAHCFYSPTQPGSTVADITNPATIGSATLTTGAHSYSAVSQNLNLTGGTVGLGDSLGIYVTGGSVYISPNGVTNVNGIEYNTAGWTINSGGKTNIPSFTLVVTGGNIYIDPNVTELDGTYVAEADSSGNGGKIYTCGDDYGAGVFEPMPTASMYNNCNKQLTVDGSLVADQVDLMRTMGSLKDATSSEGPNSAARACLNSSVNSPVCAAEVIESGPEEYLSTPATAPPNEGTPYYNAITSLPPVL